VLDGQETQILVEHLLDMIDSSRKLESAKMDLACNPDFNLMDAYGIFDPDSQGGVSPR
jgi:hypothetical protein